MQPRHTSTSPIASALPDLQATEPASSIALTRVGVTGVRAGVVLADGSTHGQPCTVTADIHVGLPGSQRGVHMSRFHEAMHSCVRAGGAAAAGPPVNIALLAEGLAREAADRQGAATADVTVVAQSTVEDTAPDSGARSLLPVDVIARSVIAADGVTRTLLSVTVAGMNACPCAQDLVRTRAAERLAGEGFSAEDIERILAVTPGATHNQRGTATLSVGATSAGDLPGFEQLCDVARDSMSGRIHELLKRGDELEIVLAAHARPHFVEDCVREALATLSARADLPADAWCHMRQVNHESIHAHDVVAERGARVRDLRDELAGGGVDAAGAGAADAASAASTTIDAWLAGA